MHEPQCLAAVDGDAFDATQLERIAQYAAQLRLQPGRERRYVATLGNTVGTTTFARYRPRP